MTALEFTNKKNFPVDKMLLSRAFGAVVKSNAKARGEVEVVITDNREMRRMNKAWRGADRTTDVLSFAWNEDKIFPKSERLGQIFISYPRIRTQAKECGVSEKEELVRMFVHGILHLLGHNHIREAEAQKMFSLQEKIVSKSLKYERK